jgi:putative membrane protein
MKVSTCLMGAALLLVPAAAWADTPREFVQKAIEGDNSEIMLSQLAQDRAESRAVRDYARDLENDHRDARAEAEDLGDRLGVSTGHGDMTSEAEDERDKLADLRGRDFDREFLHYMIGDHRKDIRDFRDEADDHEGPAGDLARRQLPTLEQHLDTALALNERQEDLD